MKSTKFTRSGRGHPCPICDRSKDADCSWNADMAYCHKNTHHKKGDQVKGWAFTGVTSDGRCGVFVPHKPLGKPQTRKTEFFEYSATQKTKRYYVGAEKRFGVSHFAGGEWHKNAGPDLWPLYRQAKVSGAVVVVELEGEKCADIAAAGGLNAVSQPGHAWSNDAHRLERYRQLAAAGTERLVIVADNDAHGIKRADASAASATQAGLQVRLLLAIWIWPDIPAGGSIDDAPGSPEQRAAALKEAAKQQVIWTQSVAVAEQQEDEEGPDVWTYTGLIKRILQAITEDDLDTEMSLKAELMNSFRVPAGQVEADLLRHQMLLETAGDRKAKPPNHSTSPCLRAWIFWLMASFLRTTKR